MIVIPIADPNDRTSVSMAVNHIRRLPVLFFKLYGLQLSFAAADRIWAGTVETGFILDSECISRIIKLDAKQKTNRSEEGPTSPSSPCDSMKPTDRLLEQSPSFDKS
jgi:hypothetical protein